MTRQRLFTTIAALLFITGSFTADAQVNPPGPTCFGGPTTIQNGATCCLLPGACGASCPDCVAVPLNSQTSILLIAGLLFGAASFKRKKLPPIKVHLRNKR